MRPVYAGATANAQGGVQLGTDPLAAGGGDFFAGYRISRWFSLEGFYAFRLTFTPVREPTEGAECSGSSTDQWNWHLGGARFWIHLFHGAALDISVAPSFGAGIGFDHNRSLVVGSICGRAPVDGSGPVISGGVFLALEARPAPWVGIRMMMTTTIDYGSITPTAFGAISWGGGIGPVFRF